MPTTRENTGGRTYTRAVMTRRKALLNGRSVRKVAKEIGIADSQIVRLLNGVARKPSFRIVVKVSDGLGHKDVKQFYADLEDLWNSIDRAERN